MTDTIIADGINGRLVTPTDIAGFVDAIRPFMRPECWQSYSQAAINHARQHYAVQLMSERYVTLFEGLQQGLYPLPMARSALRKAHRTPFTWQDYLPKPLRARLFAYIYQKS